MPSSFHRGDYRRVRRSVTVAMIELEALEPRMQLAYKCEEIPAEVVANLSLARLMVTELDGLLRNALDVAIADGSKYHSVYAESTYDKRRFVA
jgi:membrane-bound inhibitor of C-type lysozyme